MLNSIRQITAAAAIAIATTAAADMQTIDMTHVVEQVAPLQAHTINMGDYTAVVYYTEMSNGNYDVVTTIGPNTDTTGAITQHRIELTPGQRYTLNVDRGFEEDVAFNLDAESDNLTISSL